jgi:outer membrane protein assembly factor BamB
VGTRITTTAKLVTEKQWSQAVDEYLQILEESGDDLVPIDSWHDVSARLLCQLELAGFPPEALRIYGDRIDTRAKKLFEQGKTERDPRLLQRLVDEFFCSRYSDKALDLLGDLAFERGRFEEAESWWNILAPSQGPEQLHSLALVYPDPQTNLGKVHAKQLLAQIFGGNRQDLSDDLKAFRDRYSNQKGDLAGRTGNYADIVELEFTRPEIKAYLEKRAMRPRPWPTFAGDSSRNFISPKAPDRLAYYQPPWPIHISDQRHGNNGPATITQPRHFPVINGGLVFLSNARSVAGYDLATAKKVGSFEFQAISPLVADSHFVGGSLDHTVTVAGNRLYATLTIPGIELAKESHLDYVLVCLDLPPQSDGRFQLRWQRSASVGDGKDTYSPAYWEGAPVVSDDQIYVARTKTDKSRSITSIECLHADSGRLLWQKEVCFAPDTEHRRPHLLTLAGRNLVHASDSGAIVALDAATGKRIWARRYQGRKPQIETSDSSPRGLAPAVYHHGRVFAAPADFDGILCLNSQTGGRLWEIRGIEVVHLLGIAKGKLIFTTSKTDKWPASIRAVDSETGADIRQWIQTGDSGGIVSYGRGFLAGDQVFWPTQNPHTGERVLYVLNQEDGQLTVDPSRFWQVRCGNMALGGGFLAVADDENLYIYAPPTNLREQKEKQAGINRSANFHFPFSTSRFDRLK